MRRFWQLISLILIGLMVSCGAGFQYWTYTDNKPVEHIIHPTVIPVWVDASFTSGQVEEIKAAITEWNYVFNGQMFIYLVEKKALGTDKKMHSYPDSFTSYEGGQQLQKKCEQTGLGWVIYNLPSDNEHLDKDVSSSTLAFVTGIDEHSITVVSDRFGNRSMKDILMHEFAHLLGAVHVNTPCLEYPYYSNKQYSCIDKITVAQVAQVRNLDMDGLNYCITPNFL